MYMFTHVHVWVGIVIYTHTYMHSYIYKSTDIYADAYMSVCKI